MINFFLSIKLADDVPERPMAILKHLAGQSPLPPDFVFPKNIVFEDDDWQHICEDDPERAHIFGCKLFDDRILMSGTVKDGRETLQNFIAWMVPYMKEPESEEWFGFGYNDGVEYPMLMTNTDRGPRAFALSRIFAQETPVLIDPQTHDLRNMPPMPDAVREIIFSDDKQKIMQTLMEKMKHSCTDCGECEENEN